MATKESKASQLVHLRASAWGAKLFRNNSGVLPNPDGVPIRFGLGNTSKKINAKLKSPDLLGWRTVTITPEMVGKQVAVVMGVEAKSKDFKHRESYSEKSREYAQNAFLQLIIKAGGIAGFAATEVDVDRILNEFYARMNQ